ncbi:unnamed protein product [Sympodiomycopsis kandeliae]
MPCCADDHHGHSHDDDDHLHTDQGPSDLVYSSIVLSNVTCLNNTSETSPRNVLKPWSQRLDDAEVASNYLESDSDDQLLLRIPFEGSVKLKSLLLKTGPGDLTPDAVILFTNSDPPLDFSDDLESRSAMDPIKDARKPGVPAQKLESIAVTREVVEYPLRVSRFSGVRDVTLFIPGSVGGDKSRLYYVGFKGETTSVHRDGPANIIYEATPQLKDHKKVPGTDGATSNLGGGF